MIKLADKSMCCGCSACFNACHTGALTMQADKTGFWFPVINNDLCVECGACERACPVIEKPVFDSHVPNAYIVQNLDEEIRRQSTSGGAFTGIAKQVLADGGVVFGATFNENFKCVHTWVDKENDLIKFRNSKYVQSDIGYAYREVEKFLIAGRKVCFSGTPCQVYGLKKYLGGGYR